MPKVRITEHDWLLYIVDRADADAESTAGEFVLDLPEALIARWEAAADEMEAVNVAVRNALKN